MSNVLNLRRRQLTTPSVPSINRYSLPLDELIDALTPPAVPSLAHARSLANILSTHSPLPRRALLNPVLLSLCDVDSPAAVQAAGYDILSAYWENNEAVSLSTADRLSYFSLFLGSNVSWGKEIWEPRFKALRALTRYGADILGIEKPVVNILMSWIEGGFHGILMPEPEVELSERSDRERSIDVLVHFLSDILQKPENMARITNEITAEVLQFYASLVDQSLSLSAVDTPTSISNKHPAEIAVNLYLHQFSSQIKTLSTSHLSIILPLLFRALAFFSTPLPRLSITPQVSKSSSYEERITETLNALFDGPYSTSCMLILKEHLPPSDANEANTSLGAHRMLRNHIRRTLSTKLARAYISRESSSRYPHPVAREWDLVEKAWPKEDYSSSAGGLGGNGWDVRRIGKVLCASVSVWATMELNQSDRRLEGREKILEEVASILKDILQELDARDDDDISRLDEEEANIVGETLQKLTTYIVPLKNADGTKLVLPLAKPSDASTPLLRTITFLLARDHSRALNPLLSSILINIADHLTDTDTARLPSLMMDQQDLTPTSPQWLDNWKNVLDNSALVSKNRPSTRGAVIKAIFEVYDSVKDMPGYRKPLAELVLCFSHSSVDAGDDTGDENTIWMIIGEEIVLRIVEPVSDDEQNISYVDVSTYIDHLVTVAADNITVQLTTGTPLRAVFAISALVGIFNQLTFTPHALVQANLEMALLIYDHLLHIVTVGYSSAARLVALQFFMHLRADRDHRIYLTRPVQDVNNPAYEHSSTHSSHPSFVWSLPEALTFTLKDVDKPSETLISYDPDGPALRLVLPTSGYLATLITIIDQEKNWEVLSFILCHLPSQLANKHLFCGPKSREIISKLLTVLCTGILGESLANNIEQWPQGLKNRDAHGLAYHTLSVLVSYRRCFDPQQRHLLVEVFQAGLNGQLSTIKCCLHALSLSAFELQSSMTKCLSRILEKLSQIMSNPNMAVHILGFLSIIGSLPALYANFTESDFKMVFGVALQYLQHYTRLNASPTLSWALSQHVRILSYYVVYVWFLAVKLPDRPRHIRYITRQLLLANEGNTGIDEPTEVCFDWLTRYTYGSADPRPATSAFSEIVMNPSDATGSGTAICEKTWLMGNSVVTVRVLSRLGWVEVLSRRPSGFSRFLCRVENVPMVGPGDVAPDLLSLPASLIMERDLPTITSDVAGEQTNIRDILSTGEDASDLHVPDPVTGYVWSGTAPSQRRKSVDIDPSYFVLQLSHYPDIVSTPGIKLVSDPSTLPKFISSLDRIPVIDTHKVGIMYVAPGQTNEIEILRNTYGSPAYTRFLEGIGRLINLRGQVDVYAGGLDPDEDGEYAYAWWDDIGQILYHTSTMMPTKSEDPQCNYKKRHIGNDHVRIVWNDSGKPYKFDTLTTQFQFVNIVIEPHSLGAIAAFSNNVHENEYFKVTVQRAPGMTEFTPVGDFKLISAGNLPLLVRQLSLLADWFASVFARTQNDTARLEVKTNWHTRLESIRRFRNQLSGAEQEKTSQEVLDEESCRDFTTIF